MNFFFSKLKESKSQILDINEVHLNFNYKIKYYDQFKYVHFLEGKCVTKRKSANTYFVMLYSKNKGLFFSFFYNSPLILSLEKIN